jgi:hypothetical protein
MILASRCGLGKVRRTHRNVGSEGILVWHMYLTG